MPCKKHLVLRHHGSCRPQRKIGVWYRTLRLVLSHLPASPTLSHGKALVAR